MSKIFLYIIKHFLKNFFIILFGLIFIIALIDLISHLKSIDGINRAILYLYYVSGNTIGIIYPIALVFAAIMTISNLLFKNNLLVLSSFGYSKVSILKPFVVGALGVYLAVVALNFTEFAYSGDRAKAILKKDNIYKPVDNIFFKHNNSFVSAKKMDVVNKKLIDAVVYYIDGKRIKYLIEFKEAEFKDGVWIAKDIIKKSFIYKNTMPQGYDIENIKESKILEGYYPKVVSLLYEGKRMSIQDGFAAKRLLKSQNIDSTKILSALSERLLMPLFSIFLIILIIMLTPLHKRFLNKAKYYFYTIGSTLLVWSVLHSANMISVNGVIPIYFGQPLIISLIAILSLYIFTIKRGKI